MFAIKSFSSRNRYVYDAFTEIGTFIKISNRHSFKEKISNRHSFKDLKQFESLNAFFHQMQQYILIYAHMRHSVLYFKRSCNDS